MVYAIVMKSFKQHILEKLRVSSKSDNARKEYKDKTNSVNKYNAYNYYTTILNVDNIDLFMDFWYHFLESEDEGVKEKLDLYWDDIYLDYDAQDVYVLDNNTGDEITRSTIGDRRTFYNVYNRIMEYFEEKNA